MLLHHFQQRGLGFRAGPVDFVRQDDLAHHRPFPVFHLPGLEIRQGISGNIRRHQVRRKLNAAEGTVQGFRQRAGQRRLPDARNVLYQHVAPAQQGDQRVFNGLLLADDGLADSLLQGDNHPPRIEHVFILLESSRDYLKIIT